MFDEKMTEDIKDIIRMDGTPVLMDSPYCLKRRPKWKKWRRHSKCLGCESEIGCAKAALMAIAIAKEVILRVSGREDSRETLRRLREIKNKIFDAQSVEELDKINLELQGA